jgi:type II secretory pathway pseudopilin PulG
MNLRRHAAILWRYRFIVGGALLLAPIMAILAVCQVNGTHLKWRAEQTFSSDSTLLVTQHGFPEGRVLLGDPTQPLAEDKASGTDKSEQFADPNRFSSLAVVYSYFAQSDRVRAIMRPVPERDQVIVTPITAGANQATLPLLTLTTTAHEARAAKQLNNSAIEALTTYIRDQQAGAKVAGANRVEIQTLNPPSNPIVTVGRSKTPAIVAFILVLAAGLALAYCLDNLFPADRKQGKVEDEFDDEATFPAVQQMDTTARLEDVWASAPTSSHAVRSRD